jgi:hypothetical protein
MELDGAQAAGDVAYAKERLAMIDKQLGTVKALENKGLVVRGDSAEAQRAASSAPRTAPPPPAPSSRPPASR